MNDVTIALAIVFIFIIGPILSLDFYRQYPTGRKEPYWKLVLMGAVLCIGLCITTVLSVFAMIGLLMFVRLLTGG